MIQNVNKSNLFDCLTDNSHPDGKMLTETLRLLLKAVLCKAQSCRVSDVTHATASSTRKLPARRIIRIEQGWEREPYISPKAQDPQSQLIDDIEGRKRQRK